MKKELHKLIQLQEIDNQLDALRSKRGDLPEKLKKLKTQIDQLDTSISEGQTRLEVVNNDLKRLNTEIEEIHDKLKRYKDQLYLVTTNKEYDALQHEMYNTREIINSHENSIIDLEDEKIKLEDSLKRNILTSVEVKAIFDKSQVDLGKAMAETIDEENRLTPIRKELTDKIESKYLNTYSRFREARGGSGITSVTRNACGACFNHLPPQTMVEIRQNNKFVCCPNCGIYLYWKDDEI